MTPALPPGFAVGHWTDTGAATGCTVVLAPDGTVAAAEVRGGGPGTRESDLLSPASAARDVHALVFAGGSAFGLAAADGVVRWLAARDRGYRCRLGNLNPLVHAAVVFDLPRGDADAAPDAASGAAACDAATTEVARGSVGAGTGCAVGKLLGPGGWTNGGVGFASERAGDCTISALAVVNAFGDVVAEDGSLLAGPGGQRTADLLREHGMPEPPTAREATTLVALITDATLSKVDAWLVARAANTGVARAVDPAHTAVDGDAAYCLASGTAEIEPFILAALAPHVVAAAIRDAVRSSAG